MVKEWVIRNRHWVQTMALKKKVYHRKKRRALINGTAGLSDSFSEYGSPVHTQQVEKEPVKRVFKMIFK